MHYRNVSDTIRIVFLNESPMNVTYDIIVEEYRGGFWSKVIGYNSLSDDYAHTNARQYAEKLAKDNKQ
jgi:hypothetical protein